ncbi:hypothetical protein AM571_PA00099 (plasmid) [Rhizobium etli 8C-3]|uniref:Uncharacterized protein n=1 Tax=Rhizobium etli 8C-3 TaxID=538025 RepID=A0A1L5PA12_RHIET|nr:hypothetical protein AM571_PA00099 [Rhizobium etli 8C-3]
MTLPVRTTRLSFRSDLPPRFQIYKETDRFRNAKKTEKTAFLQLTAMRHRNRIGMLRRKRPGASGLMGAEPVRLSIILSDETNGGHPRPTIKLFSNC